MISISDSIAKLLKKMVVLPVYTIGDNGVRSTMFLFLNKQLFYTCGKSVMQFAKRPWGEGPGLEIPKPQWRNDVYSPDQGQYQPQDGNTKIIDFG